MTNVASRIRCFMAAIIATTPIDAPKRSGGPNRSWHRASRRASRSPCTAPVADDQRPVSFAFVSCQSLNEGKLNGYRRMIFEDERAAPDDQLGFVLHLGDFIYEVVEYPDELP